MVDITNGISGVMPKVTVGGILNGIMWFLGVIIAGAIIVYIIWWNKNKNKYSQYKAVILEKDSNGNVHETYDQAGVFLDKQTNNKLLFFKKIKKGLNPNNIPFVTAVNKKGKIVKTIYLEKVGVSNYRLLHMKLTDDGTLFKVGEEDINWAAQDLQKVRNMFGKESFLTKYAPYIAFIVTICICMIILVSLFNKFEILTSVSENLIKVAEKQLEVTQALANVTQDPTIRQNIPIIVPGTTGG